MRRGGNIESGRHGPAGWPRTLRTTCLLIACALTGTASSPATARQEESDAARRLRAVAGDQALQSDAARRAAAQAVTDERLTSVASDPARFGISPDAVRQGQVVAVRPDRTVVSDLENLSGVDPGTVFVERVRSEAVTMTPPSVLTSQGGARPVADYQLGFEVTAFEAETNRPLDTTAWAQDSTGLAVQGSTGDYVGLFNVALTLKSDPTDRSVLASPVNVAVTALGATIDPRPVAISQLGQWFDVSIAVPEVADETYEISVSADPTSTGDPVPLAVMRPSARLWSTPASVIGWGIGEATVFVEADGVRQAEGLPVSLRVSNGSLDEDRVTLDASGQAEVRLRSSRAPAATVEIMNAPLRGGEPLVVPFTAPWWFLGAAVAGGLAGAFLRGRGREHWLKALAIGIVTAVLMCVAYAVGVDWPARVLATAGIPKAAEAAVFLLGAVGALVGVSALLPGSPKAEA